MPGDCNIMVTRADLFKTSLFEITRYPAKMLQRRLMVQFRGEGGLDYGGLAREWFYLLSVEVFDPALGMFEYCRPDDYALQVRQSEDPPGASRCHPDVSPALLFASHLTFFFFFLP